MPINNLIAKPYVARPVTNYLAGKQMAQRNQMNNMQMQQKQQQMSAADEMQKLKTVAMYMKGADKLNYHEKANRLFTETGLKSPTQFDQQGLDNLLERVGMLDEPIKQDPFTLGQGQKRFTASGQEIASVSPKKSAPLVNNTISNQNESDYWKKRQTEQAELVGASRKHAESAYKGLQSLDRFLSASKGSTSGGAQPIISGVQNFLSSFGAEFSDLKNVAEMEQAVAKIKVDLIGEHGARGLTDKDMDIINDSLSRVDTSQEARESVVRIMKKAYTYDIEDYEYNLGEEERIWPDRKGFAMKPRWYGEYQEMKKNAPAQSESGLTPDEQAELEAREAAFSNGNSQFKTIPRTDR